MVESEKESLYVTLNNGERIPKLGLGTAHAEDPELLKAAVKSAISCGIRMIDTATAYKNEHIIGEALTEVFAEGSIKREDLFIVTKYMPYMVEGETVESSLKKSLEMLKIDYLDMYLLHGNLGKMVDKEKQIFKGDPLFKTWKAFEECQKAGLAKSIGVCNCNCMLIMDLLNYCEIKPVVNQIELHPYLPQTDFVRYLKNNDVMPMAFAPLTNYNDAIFERKNILDNELVKQIAEKYEKTPAQICIAWGLQRGTIVIPKSMNAERLKLNFEAMYIHLESEEIQKLENLPYQLRCYDPKRWEWLARLPLYD